MSVVACRFVTEPIYFLKKNIFYFDGVEAYLKHTPFLFHSQGLHFQIR